MSWLMLLFALSTPILLALIQGSATARLHDRD